ncbi:MAG: NAD-dependent epimerase/dehydratase family protein [Agathobacter sp.]
MNITILGAAGFIGTNLALELADNKQNRITLIDKCEKYFVPALKRLNNVTIKEAEFNIETNFDELIRGQDIVYHLVSTTVPGTSNQQIALELEANVIVTSKLLDACVRCEVKKVVYISSGGTVYGKESNCPIKEDTPTYPISSYGIQKVTIEKLLYLYHYLHDLDYRVVRLANPYGPYQRPDGVLGAVTTFTYKALCNEEIIVYGDGSVVRDFIYIDDAIRGIINIADGDTHNKIFNLGCGYGTSIKQVLDTIEQALELKLNITHMSGRKVDIPVNYLDISRYESAYGKLEPVKLYDGIIKTASFMREYYSLK